MDPLRFDNKVFIVTGAGRGIGRAYARLLASRGARVVVNDIGSTQEGDGRDSGIAQQVVREILDSGGVATANCDTVTTAEGAAAIVAAALDRYDRLDGVISNAGIIRNANLMESDADRLRSMLDVHVVGQVNVCRAVWPHFTANHYGRIVLTGSSGMFGFTELLDYNIAKAAVIGILNTVSLAGEPHGIKVNAILPAASTRMGAPPDVNVETWLAEQARQRGVPEHIAPLGAFLLHDSCPVTGTMCSAGGGGVGVIRLSETRGVTIPEIRPEDILARWSEIVDPTGAWIPTSMEHYMATFQRLHPVAPPPSC